MNDTSTSAQDRVAREALSGRLPILEGERIYDKYSTFAWTCTSFAAATWGFLIGGQLPYVGNTKIAVMGFFIGLIISTVLSGLASGMPSHKYGVDTADAAKASFGTRGVIAPLIGLIFTALGWAYVLVALTSRGAANVIAEVRGAPTPEPIVALLGFVTLGITWLIAVKGPWLFERISNYFAPGHIIVTLFMLYILVDKYGWSTLINTNVPESQAYTQDPFLSFIYAVEFGIANSLTTWPLVGGLTRLVKKRTHIVGPVLWGIGLFGAGCIGAVASFAAVAAGTYDPTVWMIRLGGPIFGTAIMIFVLIANVAAIVIWLYITGVSIQQVKFLTRVRWELLIGAFVLPGIWVTFNTQMVLDKVMTFLTYNGIVFTGVIALTLVDYFVFRRTTLFPRHLFTRSKNGIYWFWGGINWIAIFVMALGIVMSLWMYDPISLKVVSSFKYIGASVPAMLTCALVYYLLTRFIAMPLGKGGYIKADGKGSTDASSQPSSSVEISL